MTTIQVLLKKCFRDIWRNLKQFIAIIFIIAVAVTLFVGLEANSQEFTRRVDEVYSKGNVSDLWVTFNIDIQNIDGIAKDYSEIVSFNGGDKHNAEKRLYVPSTIDNLSANALITKEFPNINRPYDYVTGDDFDKQNNFFLIDEDFKTRFEIMRGEELKLGDTIPLSFETSYITSMLEGVINQIDPSILDDEFFNFIPSELKDFLKNGLTELEPVFDVLIEELNSLPSITLNFEVNGFMKHPENIQTATFNSSSYLLSSKLLLSTILDELVNNFKDDIYNLLSNSGQFNIDENTFNLIVDNLTTQIKDLVNNDQNANIVYLLDNLANQFVITIGENKTLEEVSRLINDYYNNGTSNMSLIALTNLTNMPSNAVVQSDIIQSKQLAYAFPLIFFLVAILVVLTTISQIILKERTQVGTFKSLGISKKTIFLYYIFLMGIISFIGVLLGLIIGPILIPQVMNIKYDILYSLVPIQYNFPWIVSIIIIIGVFLVVSLLTFLIIRHELNLTPANSMRPSIPKINLKERKSKPKNISLMMALRNIRVHFTKSLMVIIGVMGCTGLLICGMGVDDTLNYGKDVDLNSILGSDLQVTYNVNTPKDSIDYTSFKDSEGNPIIDKWEEFSIMQVSANKENEDNQINTFIYYFSYEATNFKYPKWDIDPNTVAMNESRANDLGISVGDYVEFTYNNQVYRKQVAKIFYTFTVSGIFIYEEAMPELASTRSNAWVTLKEGVTYLEAKEIIEGYDNQYISSVLTYEENVAKVDGYMTSIRSMTNTIKIFAIILAVIVLINLSILNFKERLRDLATLKVLGFSLFEIARSLIYETMILTVIGSLLGLCIGYPLEVLVLITNMTPIVSYSYAIFPLTFVISFLISVVTALIVNILMSLTIRKISMSESLKSIE